MRYKSKEEAQQDHIDNYRSDGLLKGKGSRYSSDYFRVRYILSEIKPNSYVLDIGVNTGAVALRMMREKKCYVKGIDIVPELVKKARKRGVFAEVGEAEDLSRFKDNSMDYVVCSEVLEHLYDPLPAMKEAHRVLKEGGKYIVTVPHPHGRLCDDGFLGDYHQQNFSLEALDTLFHNVFERNKVNFVEIKYIPEYCHANGLNPDQPQWIGLSAIK